jgi:hypothetical protein
MQVASFLTREAAALSARLAGLLGGGTGDGRPATDMH